METVVLNEKEKGRVLHDLQNYLKSTTAKWYASRGIPLRRGYLFHGPPGTGKTSLCFALAGVFGLGIYVLSLRDPSLTEEDLLYLLNVLPRRCIVLLEDIDAAGLKRDKSAMSQGCNDVKEVGRDDSQHDSGEGNGISLSGLLNAIDGVGSHEGHLLIMTTNKPRALDEALTRPGRVDLTVPFTNATREQAREIFLHTYKHDGGASGCDRNDANKPPELSSAGLADMAKEFASSIPDGMISPAAIQGFLLERKAEPRRALDEVKDLVQDSEEAQ
jgi:chaperone BCS1